MPFQKATRERSYLKIALIGPSGSGKTMSALKLAFGLGERVAMVDTENESGSLYAHLGDYDVCPISAPFTVQKYDQAIREAARSGYDVLIVDSLSHVWAAEGGLLAQKEQLDAQRGDRGGGTNKFANWRTITAQHEAFKAALLQAPIHVIGTMRTKTEYVVGEDNKPQKVGLAPVQREGMEYEFTLAFEIGPDHRAFTNKDRTGLFDGFAKPLSEEQGRTLREWLSRGAALSAPLAAPAPSDVPEDRTRERKRAFAIYAAVGGDTKDTARMRADIAGDLGIPLDSRAELTASQWREWGDLVERKNRRPDPALQREAVEGAEQQAYSGLIR